MRAGLEGFDGVHVVVVGAGACGCVAALSAAEAGARVLLLDASKGPTANTARSTGLIPAAGTRFQRAVGVLDDSPALMAEDIQRKNRGESDPALTRCLCAEAAPLIHWLVDACGCELVCHTDVLYPGQSRYRMHGPPGGYGAELLAQLWRAVEARPGIVFRRGVSVRGLVESSWPAVAEGTAMPASSAEVGVAGVQTEVGEIGAAAVVLALNGFGANRAMVREHLGPAVAEALYFGSPQNTGEGICWGIALGAETRHMTAYQGHASVAWPDGPLVTWAVVVNGAVMVNRDGRRFGDELVGYSEFTEAVLHQPGGDAWLIYDQTVHNRSLPTRYQEVVAAGKVESAPTLAALAQCLGLPAEALAATVEAYDRAARREARDEHGRAQFAPGGLRAPYCAVRVRGALFHTQGGLRVDERARVLRPGKRPIPGLYAGGGTAAGISGDGAAGYSAGNGLLAATALGRVAGREAARLALDGTRR